MIEAITYNDMINYIEDNEVAEDVVGILITRPDLHTGEEIIKSLNYYHHLTSKNINFYLPGFGAFWNFSDYPDMNVVTEIDSVKWSFSYKAFVEFIEDLEEISKWEYSGESELLLIPYYDNNFDFSEVVVFCLDSMLNDGTISSVSSFITGLSRFVKNSDSIISITANGAIRCIAESLTEGIADTIPSYISKPLGRGRHYICRDFSL